MKKQIEKLDIFSLPFAFNIFGNEKERKTIFGGCLSIIVICISITYFVYLCFLYFGNKITPSISQISQYMDQNQQMVLENNFLSFKIVLANGQSLVQLEQETNLVYYIIFAQYLYTDDENTKQYQQLSFTQCQDANLSDYYCLDFSNVSQNQKQMLLGYDSNNLGRYKIQIEILLCDPKYLGPGQQCATYEQILQKVLRIDTQIFVKMTTQQYNPKLQSFQSKIKQELLTLSDDVSVVSRLILQKATTTISSGFILQKEQTQTYFSNYDRSDSSFTFKFFEKQTGDKILGLIMIYIGEDSVSQQIQFPQFTSLLAQFSSLFNTLLVVGIFCRILAESELIQDFVEVQIKFYYKFTALKLLESQDIKIERQKDVSLSSHLIDLYQQMQNMDYKLNINKYLNVGLFQRAKLFIMSAFTQKLESNETQQVKLYKELVHQTQKQMSILELQKELMNLKIILRILLSEEQYAALKFCGYSIKNQLEKENIDEHKKQSEEEQIPQNLQNSNNISLKNNLMVELQAHENEINEQKIQNNELIAINEESIKNHLEKIDKIDEDINYFETCIKNFLQNTSLSSQSEVDVRILGCMIGVQQYNNLPLFNHIKWAKQYQKEQSEA
ncbi:hypothetical protein ABPG73_003841 [Tetrahymena malaccensis]